MKTHQLLQAKRTAIPVPFLMNECFVTRYGFAVRSCE